MKARTQYRIPNRTIHDVHYSHRALGLGTRLRHLPGWLRCWWRGGHFYSWILLDPDGDDVFQCLSCGRFMGPSE